IDWLGDIPAHWNAERIKWVAKLESGHTPDKQVPEYWVDCDVPWVSLNDTKRLENGDLIDETTNQVNAAGLANSSARILPAGAVVFSRDATIGRCGITTRPMAVSQHFIAWLCGNRLEAKYLLFVLRSMTHELNRITEGATVKTIGMTDVKLLATPVPPIEEQKAIVAFIERERRAVDVLIDMAQAAVARLTEYREGIISAAVTGKIDVREEAEA
ncbi:MAG: restriction endonuclease subunit S, partial [Phycisphaerales bacterium]|nr:restriction endonuclease subunit S [Phycisphaerales bacterium]